MADIFSKQKRSQIMSNVRSSQNKTTELKLIAIFRRHRIVGWRRRWPIPGKPDFVFPKARLAIFVDGCFWHGCPKHGEHPASNRAFWSRKITRNRERDREVYRLLRSAGWRIGRIWEHELAWKNEYKVARKIHRLISLIPA